MKVTIIRTEESVPCYPDADTGLPDADNKQASEPVRVLPEGDVEPVLLTEEDLPQLRETLASTEPPNCLELARLAGISPATAKSWLRTFPPGEWALEQCTEAKSAARHVLWEIKEKERKKSFAFWIFRNKLVKVEGWETASREEVVTSVKYKVLSEEKAFANMRREIDLFEQVEESTSNSRQRITEDVMTFVWRRDEGKCIRCGSQESIEFDHVIPVAKGGSNTARNIQLLCEHCNRKKGSTV